MQSSIFSVEQNNAQRDHGQKYCEIEARIVVVVVEELMRLTGETGAEN